MKATEGKRIRNLILADEVWQALKTHALITGTTVSLLVENICRKYLAENRAAVQSYAEKQASLFDNAGTKKATE